MPGIGKHTESI